MELQLIYARSARLTPIYLGRELEQALARLGVAVDLRGYSRELLLHAGGGFAARRLRCAPLVGGRPRSGQRLPFRMQPSAANGAELRAVLLPSHGRPPIGAMSVAGPPPQGTDPTSQIERLLLADVPEAFIWWPSTRTGISTDFSGFQPNAIIDTWNGYDWDI